MLNCLKQLKFCFYVLPVMLCAAPLHAEILNFHSVLNKAVSHSIEYQIALTEVEIERHKLNEARSVLFPDLNIRFGNEYAHIIGNGGVDSVGDVVIANDESSYKHSLIVSTGYNLFSFGADSMEIESVKHAIQASEFEAQKVLFDVQLMALGNYSEGLKLSKQIEARKEVLIRRKNIYKYIERLHRSGSIDSNEYNSAAVVLAEESGRMDNLYVELQQVLNALESLTGEELDAETVVFSSLHPESGNLKALDARRFAEIRTLEEQIVQKDREISAASRRKLPRLTLSGAYRMFGSDAESFSESLSNLEGRDAVVTIYLDWPLFTGFKQSSQVHRLREELRRIKLLRLKKIEEKEGEIKLIRKVAANYTPLTELHNSRIQHLEQIQKNVQRLSEQQLMNKVSFEKEMIDSREKHLDAEMEQIDLNVAMVKLELMGRQIQ